MKRVAALLLLVAFVVCLMPAYGESANEEPYNEEEISTSSDLNLITKERKSTDKKKKKEKKKILISPDEDDIILELDLD